MSNESRYLRPMRLISLFLLSGLVIAGACQSLKSKKQANQADIGWELRQRTDNVVGLCMPEPGSSLLYFGLDSLYYLSALSGGSFPVSILGTDSRYEEMQNDPYWNGSLLPLVYYNGNGIKSDDFFNVIFFDRVSDRLSAEELGPLLVSSYHRLNETGRLVVLFSKKKPQLAQSHLKAFENQVELRKWSLDTTFSQHFQVLTIVK